MASSEISNENSNESEMDLINRRDAIELLDNLDSVYLENYDDSFVSHTDLINALYDKNRLQSAQPNLPEWAKKVEEYRAGAPGMVHNPLAWALYQVWKEYDR